MNWRVISIGVVVLLLGTVTTFTLFGDCLREHFSSSAEALAGPDWPTTSGVRKNLSNFSGSDFEAPRPAARATTLPSQSRSWSPQSTPAAETGQLTAGDWDDNLNFDLFLSYARQYQAGQQAYAGFDVTDRIIVAVRDDRGRPIAGAQVTLPEQDFIAPRTAADGRVALVPSLDGIRGKKVRIQVRPPHGRDTVVLAALPSRGGELPIVIEDGSGTRPSQLDLAFVVDTTGSMGDELAYLRAELDRIAASVGRAFPEVQIRFGLVAYRDLGDDYVTLPVDFTSLAAFRARLNQLSAGGGGDEPEALDRAMVAMNELSWNPAAAKVAFLVADAPAHPENARRFHQAVNVARLRGVRIFSIAASDTRDDAEFLFRSAAQLTLGRYLFLTDDSRIGNAHGEPHIPCYQVQRLSNLMASVVRSELSGVREEPAPAEILRTVGNPAGGTCRQEIARAQRRDGAGQ